MQKAGAYLLSPPLADPVTKIRNRFLWQPKLPRSSFITDAKRRRTAGLLRSGRYANFLPKVFVAAAVHSG